MFDKFAGGGRVSFSTSKAIDDKEADKDTWSKTNSWSVAPFARYTFVSFGNFALKGEAVAYVGQSIPISQLGSTTKGWKTTSIGLNVTPLITYALNDHFELEAGLDFFSIGASTRITKDPEDDDNSTVINTIGFDFDSDNVTTLGLIFKL